MDDLKKETMEDYTSWDLNSRYTKNNNSLEHMFKRKARRKCRQKLKEYEGDTYKNMEDDNELVNEVYLEVPLSGSQIFDIHSRVTARNLCILFPGLQYKVEDNMVKVFGKLNDYWYKEFNKAVFSIGELDGYSC